MYELSFIKMPLYGIIKLMNTDKYPISITSDGSLIWRGNGLLSAAVSVPFLLNNENAMLTYVDVIS